MQSSSSPPVTSLNNTSTNGAEASIGDLISEAMEDDTPSASVVAPLASTAAKGHAQTKGEGPRGNRRGHTPSHSVRPHGDKTREESVTSKLQIHQSSEKSIHICFSDSDDDDAVRGAGVRVEQGSVGSGRRGWSGTHSTERRQFEEEEEEDGFCIVETPTSTSVVSSIS